MKSVSVAEARRNFADLLNRASYGRERTVVTRHGRAVGAIVPVEDVELLESVLRLVSKREIRDALREADEQGAVEWGAIRDLIDR